ncbi:uncharacterized protein SCHCODRAFT_02643843 [Schizophyllum commune H4-8]|uniref:uncharacterized protein n=1 Tax=Schizophyllum commune (strain H4-8 / FGSC 9210) TaxID=578458 RepID=UPI00215E1E3C|nr:uncharacterized protein SCHCODRAFT_02643843 [Schizophyllum commune H4-8]KAI5885587.1 hypothetical protein SCHCODRAFT_02643843 [Schizophyllum commune H4-8]
MYFCQASRGERIPHPPFLPSPLSPYRSFSFAPPPPPPSSPSDFVLVVLTTLTLT